MVRRLATAEFWSQSNRNLYGSLGVSTATHLALIAGLALIVMQGSPGDERPQLDSRFSKEVAAQAELAPPTTESAVQAAGGASFGYAPQNAVTQRTAPSVRVAEGVSPIALAPSLDVPLNAEVGPLESGVDGVGAGDGAGTAEGSGDGFFGLKPAGNTFVFVVDSSDSMHHAHDSEAKTRFRRVKQELYKAIKQMDAQQRFYVVFFNDKAVPMPAVTLQPALPHVQRRYLEWVARFRCGGQPTDPREALRLALRLQPDVIYFLTDGAFWHRAQKELKQLVQRRSVIHTFSFGDAVGEETMKTVAQNNRGTYKFIP